MTINDTSTPKSSPPANAPPHTTTNNTQQQPTHKSKTPLVSFISGGIAGITAKSVVSPLERVKILFQVKSKHYQHESGIFKTLFAIGQKEGVSGLFRGNLATVARIFPYAAIQFCTYEQVTKYIRQHHNSGASLSPLQHLLAGSIAGAVSVVFTYPLDLARARLAVEVDQKPSLTTSLSRTFRNEGIRGLYRGVNPTLLGIVPYAGINFSVFDTLKKQVPRSLYTDKGEIPIPLKLACGGLAGAMGQTVAYPLDVVRRRMQTAGHASIPQIDQKHGTLSLAVDIIRKEGWRALFKGLSINYYKVVPAVSISFTTYEFVASKLQQLLNKT